MSTASPPLHRRRAPGRPRRAWVVLAVLLVAATLITILVDRMFSSSSSPAGTGSGIAATQARSLPPFTGVDLAGANNVIVHVGARESVIVHADNNLLSRVTTQVRSASLVIGTSHGNLNAKSRMFVEVNLPSVNALTLQGHGTITATGINSPAITASISGSGTIYASGATKGLHVTISGSGSALLDQLIARDAKASLSGNGSIMLTATHSLNASASGNGSILYRGDPPHVTTTLTGNGTIRPG